MGRVTMYASQLGGHTPRHFFGCVLRVLRDSVILSACVPPCMVALIILVQLSLPDPHTAHATSLELDSSNLRSFARHLYRQPLSSHSTRSIRCSCLEIVPCRSLVRQRPRPEKTVKGSRCPICAPAQPPHHCITRSLSKEPHCRSIHIGKSLLAYSLTATSTRTDKADSTAALSSCMLLSADSPSSCASARCERAVIAF